MRVKMRPTTLERPRRRSDIADRARVAQNIREGVGDGSDRRGPIVQSIQIQRMF
jgi:hypothetical protein